MTESPSKPCPQTSPKPLSEDAMDSTFATSQISAWTLKQRIGRLVWMFVNATLFRWSFHNWYAWRRLILRAFGAKVGNKCVIRPTARIEVPWNLSIGDYSSIGDHARIYNLGTITIGRRCTISQHAHLCAGTHDYNKPDMPLLRPPISIGDDAWIATDAFVGPGVIIGCGTLLGARACAYKNLDPWMIYAGNPAKPIKPRVISNPSTS